MKQIFWARWPGPWAVLGRRWTRKKSLFLGGVAAVLALVIGLDLMGWPGLAPWLAAHLNGPAARPRLFLAAGSRVHLLWGPRLLAPTVVVVRSDRGDSAEVLAQAEGLELRWRWADVWAWEPGQPVRLAVLDVDQLTLRWQRDAQAQGNWQFGPRMDGASTAPLAVPEIGHLRIGRGEVDIDDQPLGLQAVARFSTQADGHWQADVQGRLRGQVMALQASASAGLPLLSTLPGPPIKLKATLSQGRSRVSFDGQAASLLDARALDGLVQVAGPSMAAVGLPLGVSLPRTGAFSLTGRLRHDGAVWRLETVRATVGQSHLRGAFALTPGALRPLLTGTLHGGPLLLADLGPVIGTDIPPKRPGRVLPDHALNLPALVAMDARVQVKLSALDPGTPAVAPLTPLNALLSLDGGVLRVSELNAGVAGGSITGETVLDTRVAPPQWTATLALQGMAVDRWLPALRRSRASPGDPVGVLTGQLQGRVQVKGRGQSVAELLGSLDGELSLALRDGQLSHLVTEVMGLDIAQGLGVWLRGDDNLVLNCAVLQGSLRAGVLRPRLAVIDSRDSRIELSGQLSLASEQINLRAVATPKDFSPLTLRAPLRVVGMLGAPQVALEGRALGTKIIAAMALGALAPPAMLLPFIDPGETLAPINCP